MSAVTVFMVRSWLHDAALELRRRGANMNHVLSLITFAVGALCFVVFITALRPPLHQSEVAVGSIYGRGDVT